MIRTHDAGELRAEHASDRRQKVVSLSDAGRRLVEELMKARLKEFRASVEHVKPALRHELSRLAMACGFPHPGLVPLDRFEVLVDRYGAVPASEAFTVHSTYAPTVLGVLTKPVPE